MSKTITLLEDTRFVLHRNDANYKRSIFKKNTAHSQSLMIIVEWHHFIATLAPSLAQTYLTALPVMETKITEN